MEGIGGDLLILLLPIHIKIDMVELRRRKVHAYAIVCFDAKDCRRFLFDVLL